MRWASTDLLDQYTIVPIPRMLVVTGASGAGKTATVQAVEARLLPGVQCFYFDSIGVPTADVMQRDYGGGEQWQASATTEWHSRMDHWAAYLRGEAEALDLPALTRAR